MNSVSFFRSANLSMPSSGCAISTCGSFWNSAATSMVGTFCATASKPCSVLALRKKSILPTGSRMRLFTFGPPGTMVTSSPYLPVGAVGERLVEAAMLGLGHPVGAERDLVESCAPTRAAPRRRRRRRPAPSRVFLRVGATASVAPFARRRENRDARLAQLIGERSLMTLPRRDWMEMTWQEIAGADGAPARWIAVLPLAAVEQHGPHLPLGVDSYIAEAYLARVQKILPDGPARDFPAGAAHRRLGRASVLSGHADALGDDRDRRLDRTRREPGARRRAQARAGHQPRRQCRGDGVRGARPARAARHAGGHRRLASLRLSGRHVFRRGEKARHSRRRHRDLAHARGAARYGAHGQGARTRRRRRSPWRASSNGSAPTGRPASPG